MRLPLREGERRAFTMLDAVLLIALAAVGTWLVWRATAGLNYNWNWKVIPQYFFKRSRETGRWIPNLLVEGFLATLKLSFWSSIVALFIGTVMGLLLSGKNLGGRLFGRAYVELIRNLPPLVLVFIFYFFLGNQIMEALRVRAYIDSAEPMTRRVLAILFAPPGQYTEFLSGIITLGIYEGAYITEIVRAGIQSVPKGQWEAAYALGLSPWHKFRHIIMPQALRNILPALAGQFISAIKDSAIVSVISIQELTFQGLELMSATYLTFETWLTITVMYFIMTFGFSLGTRKIEETISRPYR